MDTKWKKSKCRVGILCGFLGLTMANVLLVEAASAVFYSGQKAGEWLKDAAKEDYQETSAFQYYMEGYLEDFLAMAAGEMVGFSWERDRTSRAISYSSDGGVEQFGYALGADWPVTSVQFGGSGGNVTVTTSETTLTSDFSGDPAEIQGYYRAAEGMAESGADASDDTAASESDSDAMYAEAEEAAEEKVIEEAVEETQDSSDADDLEDIYRVWYSREEIDAAAKEAQADLSADPNLCYRICYDGKELYASADTEGLDGKAAKLPEGFNFLLYFDGERVHMWKDGAEIDPYGDGQYRQGSGWFVPGYTNFPVPEKYQKAEITIAVRQMPQSRYGSSVSDQTRMYRIWKSHQETRENGRIWLTGLGVAVGLLLICLLCRREVRGACEKIAGLTGKLWFELKLLALVCSLHPLLRAGITRAGESRYGSFVFSAGVIPELIFFWVLWLVDNDWCRNKKVYKNSLCVILRESMNLRMMKWPFQKRAVRRFRGVWISGLLETVLLLVIMLVWSSDVSYEETLGAFFWPLLALTAIGCMFLQFRYLKALRRDALDMGRVVDQIEAVRAGDMEAPLLLPADSDLHDAVTNLNEIQEGMKKAVEEQVRSERMKVELVANVSHDIKTPLTSIISYVELLKEEELPAHVKDYIATLDGKAQRLKTMVQDVFEISKAASGELSVKQEQIDFAKLLRQTLADMQEDIAAAPVTVKTQIPEEEMRITADGQRMYRVFQNLIQNALKYSLPGSRVYVTLKEQEGKLTASVTNTSAAELSEEIDYTARFTRGDSSRTDGGSGLGLSIARSFTEVCGGELKIGIVADLFTASVEFAKAGEPQGKDGRPE